MLISHVTERSNPTATGDFSTADDGPKSMRSSLGPWLASSKAVETTLDTSLVCRQAMERTGAKALATYIWGVARYVRK
jgi:hypothetical protein